MGRVDPRTLWKVLPTDPTAPYQTPDSAIASIADVNGMTFAAASLRGRRHAHRGSFRDDSMASAWLSDTGWLIVAVSDGAGSAKFSRTGSRLACETFVEDLSVKLQNQETNDKWLAISDRENQAKSIERLLLESVHHAVRRIQDEAAAHQESVSAYAATFLGYVLRKVGEDWLVSAIGIGDGAIGLIDGNGGFQLLNEPDVGEFVGQTRFITTPEVWQNPEKHVKSVWVPSLAALVSMTDGVSDPIFETDANLKDATRWQMFVRLLSAELDNPSEGRSRDARLLSWLEFYLAGHHDDRTITLLAGKEISHG